MSAKKSAKSSRRGLWSGKSEKSPRVRAKQERTQGEIVEAAVRVLKARGLAGLTVQAVAAEAKLTPQSVHYYFRSREELASAVVELLSRREMESTLRDVADIDDPVDSLILLVRSVVAHYRNDLEMFRARYVWPQVQAEDFRYDLSHTGPLAGAVIAAVESKLLRGQQEGLVHPDLDAGAIAVLVWNLAFALITRESLLRVTKFPTRYDLDKLTDSFCDMIRRAVRVKVPARLDDARTVA